MMIRNQLRMSKRKNNLNKKKNKRKKKMTKNLPSQSNKKNLKRKRKKKRRKLKSLPVAKRSLLRESSQPTDLTMMTPSIKNLTRLKLRISRLRTKRSPRNQNTS